MPLCDEQPPLPSTASRASSQISAKNIELDVNNAIGFDTVKMAGSLKSRCVRPRPARARPPALNPSLPPSARRPLNHPTPKASADACSPAMPVARGSGRSRRKLNEAQANAGPIRRQWRAQARTSLYGPHQVYLARASESWHVAGGPAAVTAPACWPACPDRARKRQPSLLRRSQAQHTPAQNRPACTARTAPHRTARNPRALW